MRFLSLAGRNTKEIIRDPVSVVLGIALPTLLLFLFVSIGQGARLEIFEPHMLAPAVIVFGYAFLIMFTSLVLAKDRESAFLARLLAAPLRPADFILAYSLPYLPIAILQTIVLYAVAFIIGLSWTPAILLTFVPMLIVAVACIGIGMVLGSLCTENQTGGFGSVLIVIASLFSGAWMDLEMVGGVFETIGYALPFAHAIRASRDLLAGATLGHVMPDLWWVIAYAVGLSLAGVLAFRLKTRR